MVWSTINHNAIGAGCYIMWSFCTAEEKEKGKMNNHEFFSVNKSLFSMIGNLSMLMLKVCTQSYIWQICSSQCAIKTLSKAIPFKSHTYEHQKQIKM